MITCNLNNQAQLKLITYFTSMLGKIKDMKQDEAIKALMEPLTRTMSDGDKFQYYFIAHKTLATVMNYHLFENPTDTSKLIANKLDPTSLYQKAEGLKTSQDVEALYKEKSEPEFSSFEQELKYYFGNNVSLIKSKNLNVISRQTIISKKYPNGVGPSTNTRGAQALVKEYERITNKWDVNNSQNLAEESKKVSKAESAGLAGKMLADSVKGSFQRAMVRDLKEKGEAGRAKRHPKETDKQWNKRVENLKRVAKEIDAGFVNIGDEIWLTNKSGVEILRSLKTVKQQAEFLKNHPNRLNLFMEWYTITPSFRQFDMVVEHIGEVGGQIVFTLDNDATEIQRERLGKLGIVRTIDTKSAPKGKLFLVNGKYLVKEMRKDDKGYIKGVKKDTGKLVRFKNITSTEEIPITNDMNFVSLEKIGVPQSELQIKEQKNIDLFLEERGIENDALYRQLEESGIISIVC